MKWKNKIPYLAIIFIWVAADQFSKWLVKRSIPLYDSVDIKSGFFRLWHVHNAGAVWGILSQHESGLIPRLITLLAIISLLMVLYFFLRVPASCRLELVSFSLILGGALGNICDRLRLGYVVDFLDFYVHSWHFPTFNLADSGISIGVALMAISFWRGKCTQF